MTPVRRTTSLAVGLPVLAVLLSSVGLAAPATAADEPTLPTSPLAATLQTTTAKVVTGKKVTLTGTSPSLASLGSLLPLPLPDVAIQRSVAGGGFEKVAEVEPAPDGSFTFSATQARSSTYRAVPIAPVGELITVVIPPLVASDPVTVTTQGTVSVAAKRVARRTYVVSGKALPATAGQRASVYVKQGSRFALVGRTKTTATGAYALRAKLPKGKRGVRVVTTSTPGALGATTTRVVRIR